MRWRPLGLVSGLLVAGCGGSAEESAPAQPTPSPEIQEIAVDVPITGTVHVVGEGTLLAADGRDSSPGGLVRSTDLGASWQPVALPGAPSGFEIWFGEVEAIDDVAVVTWNGVNEARPEHADDGPHVWVSRDGTDWNGGRLPSAGLPSYGVGPEVAVADDRLVAGVVTEQSGPSSSVELFYSDDTGASWLPAELPTLDLGTSAWIDRIWRSDEGALVAVIADESLQGSSQVLESDDGASWHLGSCPDEAAADSDTCEEPMTIGSLRYGADGMSSDGGETWHQPVVEPVPEPADGDHPVFQGIVQLPGGSWLASVSFLVDQEMDYEVLVRSNDGVHWRQVVERDPCIGDDLFPRFSTPVPLGEGALVVHSCRDYAPGDSTETVWADLYVTGRDGTDIVEVGGSRRDADARRAGGAYEQPVVVGDVVVVPVSVDGDLTILHVRRQ